MRAQVTAVPSVSSNSASLPQSRGLEPPQTSPLLDRSGKLPDGTGNRQDGNIGASGSGPVGLEPQSFLSAGSNSSEGQVHIQQPQLQQSQQQSMQAFQDHQIHSQQRQCQSGSSGSGLSQQHDRMSPATISLISGSAPAGLGQVRMLLLLKCGGTIDSL